MKEIMKKITDILDRETRILSISDYIELLGELRDEIQSRIDASEFDNNH